MSIQPNDSNKDKSEKAVQDALEAVGTNADNIDLSGEEAREAIANTAALMDNQNRASRRAQNTVKKSIKANQSKSHSIHQIRPNFDQNFANENKQKIQEAYETFDESEPDPMELAKHLEKSGIHAHITNNYHRKAKHGIGTKDEANLVLAYYHNPISVTIDKERIVLDGFVEEIVTPREWVINNQPQQDEAEEEPVKKKSALKRMFSKKDN